MSQTDFTTAELATLAVEQPLKWLDAVLAAHDLEQSDVGEMDGLELDGLQLIEVSSEGGCEGGGEHAEVTFAIAAKGRVAKDGRVEGALAYVETTGYYSSDYGTEWDNGFYVVEPRDVTVVQYFAK
jgi:hypothetical protein